MSQNPLFTIWVRPRETVRRIVTESPGKFVVFFACILGVNRLLGRASLRDLGEEMSFHLILIAALVVGPLVGLLMVWLWGLLFWWTGRWIRGVGTRKEIRTAIVWGLFPLVVATFIWIPQIIVLGPELFQKETPAPGGGVVRAPGVIAFAILQLVLGVWAIVLVFNTVAEVQGYGSAWTAVLNFFLAGLVMVIPVVAIVFIILAMR
jgi:hypothetical protein